MGQLGRDTQRVRVEDLRLVEYRAPAALVRRVRGKVALQTELGIFGGRLSHVAVKLHTLAHSEGPLLAVGADLPTSKHAGDQLSLVINANEGIEHRLDIATEGARGTDDGIENAATECSDSHTDFLTPH